jgi:hypothetical protein
MAGTWHTGERGRPVSVQRLPGGLRRRAGTRFIATLPGDAVALVSSLSARWWPQGALEASALTAAEVARRIALAQDFFAAGLSTTSLRGVGDETVQTQHQQRWASVR